MLVLLLGSLLTHALAGSHPVQQNVVVMANAAPLGMRVPMAVMVVCVGRRSSRN
ncbi:MAG: hypothetical protein ACREP0_08645 [Rhodanobacteraceae bacterium]